MKILLLSRQEFGGLANYAKLLQEALVEKGHEVRWERAESWMPKETGPKPDRTCTDKLKPFAAEYDLVHALGYRPAWACSEAFKHKKPWVYTAYDYPKSNHKLVIDHLNDSQVGICTSRALYRSLDDVIATGLQVVTMGVPEPVAPCRESARLGLNLKDEDFVIAGLGRWIQERGFGALIAAMESIAREKPEAKLLLGGEGPLEESLRMAAYESSSANHIRILGKLGDPMALIAAADLFVVPSYIASFSMTAVEAMHLGIPVMLRDAGGLHEMIDPDVSGLLFETDDNLAEKIVEAINLPLTREVVGGSGRVRAQEHFSWSEHVRAINDVYESVLG